MSDEVSSQSAQGAVASYTTARGGGRGRLGQHSSRIGSEPPASAAYPGGRGAYSASRAQRQSREQTRALQSVLSAFPSRDCPMAHVHDQLVPRRTASARPKSRALCRARTTLPAGPTRSPISHVIAKSGSEEEEEVSCPLPPRLHSLISAQSSYGSPSYTCYRACTARVHDCISSYSIVILLVMLSARGWPRTSPYAHHRTCGSSPHSSSGSSVPFPSSSSSSPGRSFGHARLWLALTLAFIRQAAQLSLDFCD